MQIGNRVGLSTPALVLLITGAIDSIRNLPATALFGSSLIFFFIFSAIIFLIPVALVSAELASTNTNKGGIYHWAHTAFGEKWALFSVWLQWINTIVWFPTILSFIAGTATYFINPDLAQDKLFLVSVILVIFWAMTFINLKGVQTSAKFANTCSLIGMVIPMVIIICMAIAWICVGKPLQIHFTATSLIPSLTHSENWLSLTAIMTSFLGMELATVHIKDVKQPQTAFPQALLYSVIVILITMIMGSLAIAIVLPKDNINLVAGVMQAFTNFFGAYHMSWLIPVITGMLLIGSLGNMTSWIISPVKGLLQAAQTGYLPPFLMQENKHGVASNLLITQAVLVTFICLAFLLMPSVNGSYWLLSALSTQLYMIMYVLMFVAAICLKYKLPTQAKAFSIPGGIKGMWTVCITGLIGCAITLIVGFIPPTSINVGSAFQYDLIFTSGIIAMILPVGLLFLYKNKFSLFASKPEPEISALELEA